jgi:hypothetical protein
VNIPEGSLKTLIQQTSEVKKIDTLTDLTSKLLAIGIGFHQRNFYFLGQAGIVLLAVLKCDPHFGNCARLFLGRRRSRVDHHFLLSDERVLDLCSAKLNMTPQRFNATEETT